MKNVTITLDEDVACWIRIRAAEKEISVSRLVGEMLREKMRKEENYQASRQEYLSPQPQPLKNSDEKYPRRKELHDRQNLH